jgi:[ribosomal protein S5]-alanine N-acetyltransferase
MKSQPTLHTPRLTLRPFRPSDAPDVQRLAGAYEVALNTLTVPHPYPDGAAEVWIEAQKADFEHDRVHNFAVAEGEQLAGSMGLMMRGDGIAEIGYWVGMPFQGRGFATEAGAELIRYGFEDVGLHRIYAGYFSRNAASGRVMEKLGMTYEGTLRHHALKWGEYLDVVYYGVLRDEWRRG